MSNFTLHDLQASIQYMAAFRELGHFFTLSEAFLEFIASTNPTRIISPTHNNYVFYQYTQDFQYKITRPLNTNLFIDSLDEFKASFERFIDFLTGLRKYREKIIRQRAYKKYIEMGSVNKIVYTIQQTAGSIADSFENSNQSRKKAGQLFEIFIRLIIQELGLVCEPRTVNIPIPGYPGYTMPYQLDLVFSRNKVLVTSETNYLDTAEIVGSVKTTSKDRIDKIFLDKYLLTKLLGRNIPVIAIFLHDVQRAKKGNSIFGINSTFKTNHFLGYTVALNRLDGVYYVDPRPEMVSNQRLREQIRDFQTFLIRDLWIFSKD
jgi:hypothetical protein